MDRSLMEQRLRIQQAGPSADDLRRWEDPCEWINDTCWTYNPRLGDMLIPVELWPAQRRYVYTLVASYLQRTSIAIVKPRDIGATWVGLFTLLWLTRRYPGMQATLVSLKRDAVDVLGNMDTLFEKLRWLVAKLPAGSGVQVSDGSKSALLRLANGALIKGGWGDDPGRGGRSGLVLWDEVAAHPRQDVAWSSLQHLTDCAWLMSTYSAPGNFFYRCVQEGVWSTFSFRWQDHPGKNAEWYERARREASDPVLFAREVDCDPHASVSGMLFQEEWLQACVKVQLPDGRGLAGYDPAGEGQCEPILCLRSGNRVTEFRRIDGSLRHRAQEVDRLSRGRSLAYDADGGWGATTADELKGRSGIMPIHGATPAPTFAPWNRCANMRTALYWSLARRAERTYERMQGANVPLEECLQLPADQKLLKQLRSIRVTETPNGLISLPPKRDLAQSPDRADALAYTEAFNLRATPFLVAGRG